MILQPGLTQNQLIAKQINEDLAKLSAEERAKIYEGTLPEDGSIELSHFEAIPGAPTDEIGNDTVTPNTSVIVSFTPPDGGKVKIKFSYRRLNVQEILKRKGLASDPTDSAALDSDSTFDTAIYTGEKQLDRDRIGEWGDDLYVKLIEKIALPDGDELSPPDGFVPTADDTLTWLSLRLEALANNKTTVGTGDVVARIRRPEHGVCVVKKDTAPANTEEFLNGLKFFKNGDDIRAVKEEESDITFEKIILPEYSDNSIPQAEFKDLTDVADVEIVLPDSVRDIKNEAFANTGINVKEFLTNNAAKIRNIGDNAFTGSTSDEVTIPEGVDAVGTDALGVVTTVKTASSNPEKVVKHFAKLPGGVDATYTVEPTHELGEIEWESGYSEQITHTKVVYANSKSKLYLTANETDNATETNVPGDEFFANIRELYVAPGDEYRGKYHNLTVDVLDIYSAIKNNRPGDMVAIDARDYHTSTIEELFIGDRRDFDNEAFNGGTINIVRVKTEEDKTYWTQETDKTTFKVPNLTKEPLFLLEGEDLPPKELVGTGFLYTEPTE